MTTKKTFDDKTMVSMKSRAEAAAFEMKQKRMWYEGNEKVLSMPYFSDEQIYLRGMQAGYELKEQQIAGEKMSESLDKLLKVSNDILNALDKEKNKNVKT